MFFGLCNSPATFQTMMNDILHPFIDCNEAVCYMDDILIYSASLVDHQRITREILQTLHSYKLFLQLVMLDVGRGLGADWHDPYPWRSQPMMTKAPTIGPG